ncbi:MAG: hypothetical protein H9Q65_06250 [Spiroplasma ixodetis]|nr:hypothetical protein [Spiroplasma ixodetis]MBP1527215.1 hypothetical protein [Spiroplasma ixodetis]MBP1528823.1 hypothetical protein [Spiroplasma ixodetis]
MKRKLSYKKMLATVGALTVVLPMSLSIASCVEWQHFLGLFFGRHLFLIFDRS